jgi:polysaccharide deacetylase 2 family uncharacterized protein YibQ
MANKTPKNKKTISKIKVLNIFLGIFLFAFLTTTLSYFILKNENSNENIQHNLLDSNKNENLTKEIEVKKFQEKKLEEFKEIAEIKEEVIEQDKFEEKTEEFKKDYLNTDVKEIEEDFYSKKDNYNYNKKNKPKLAVIIDDVSSTYQKKKVLSVGKKITMAFLPPTKKHTNSASIAQDSHYHMVHLPMEASAAFKSVEENTLTTKDSYEHIEQTVKRLRELYPNVKYLNNHTGSVFTENEESMNNLFKALKKYDFIFVDSRTTAKSKAKKYAKKYNMPYIVRNIFLDNHRDFNYIQGQLKKAVKIAKIKGYSVAIGHPYRVTMKVLKESPELLKDVELVYINELPYL